MGLIASEAIAALISTLLFTIDSIDGLSVLILDIDLACGIFDRHANSDHFNKTLTLLIWHF